MLLSIVSIVATIFFLQKQQKKFRSPCAKNLHDCIHFCLLTKKQNWLLFSFKKLHLCLLLSLRYDRIEMRFRQFVSASASGTAAAACQLNKSQTAQFCNSREKAFQQQNQQNQQKQQKHDNCHDNSSNSITKECLNKHKHQSAARKQTKCRQLSFLSFCLILHLLLVCVAGADWLNELSASTSSDDNSIATTIRTTTKTTTTTSELAGANCFSEKKNRKSFGWSLRLFLFKNRILSFYSWSLKHSFFF